MINKSVLLTGHSGFIGRQIAKSLTEKDYYVNPLTNEHGKVIRIEKPFEINSSLTSDIIIHVAGKAHTIPRAEQEKKLFYDVNYQGTVNLCQAIDKLEIKPRAFIFISSVAVYGVDSGENINEEHPLNGTTPYAHSKILAEEYLKSWAEKHSIVLSILRLPLAAGPNPPGNLGAMIKGLDTGKYLSIGKAISRKSIVWSADIVKIIPSLVEKGGIYNITDGHHPSFGELEKHLSARLGRSRPIKVPTLVAKMIGLVGDMLGSKFPINSNKLAKITSTLTFDDAKARRELEWHPTPVLSKVHEMLGKSHSKEFEVILKEE